MLYFAASASHFLRKAVFAAPAKALPFLPTAFASQADALPSELPASHFFINDFFAAPARGLPLLPTAFASQPAAAAGADAAADAAGLCANAALEEKMIPATANMSLFIANSLQGSGGMPCLETRSCRISLTTALNIAAMSSNNFSASMDCLSLGWEPALISPAVPWARYRRLRQFAPARFCAATCSSLQNHPSGRLDNPTRLPAPCAPQGYCRCRAV